MPGIPKNYSVPAAMAMADMPLKSVFQHTASSSFSSGMVSPIAMAMSPATGSPKTTKKESNLLPPELQGISVKELVKALGKIYKHVYTINSIKVIWVIVLAHILKGAWIVTKYAPLDCPNKQN